MLFMRLMTAYLKNSTETKSQWCFFIEIFLTEIKPQRVTESGWHEDIMIVSDLPENIHKHKPVTNVHYTTLTCPNGTGLYKHVHYSQK